MLDKSTDTHLEYVILIAFPLLQWVGQRSSILHFTYTSCLVCERDYLVVKGIRLCKARLHYWVSSPDCGTVFLLHKPAQPNSGTSQPPIQSVPGIVSLYVRRPEHEAIVHFHLLLRLRICVAIFHPHVCL
jgi:hypothetical protein